MAERSSAASTPRQRKPRRPKASIPNLSDEQEDDTIQWIRDNDVLYNRRHKRFREVQYKEGLWQDQASRLDITVDELKVWWDSLRTRWGRLTKPGKSGAGVVTVTDREAWILQSLAFLKPFITRLHGESAVKLATLGPDRPVPPPPVDSDAETAGLDSDDEGTAEPAEPAEPAAAPARKRRRHPDTDERRQELVQRREETRELTATIRELVGQTKNDGRQALAGMMSSLVHDMDDSVFRPFHSACLAFINEWQNKSWDAKDRRQQQQQPQQQQQQQQVPPAQPAQQFFPQQQQQQQFQVTTALPFNQPSTPRVTGIWGTNFCQGPSSSMSTMSSSTFGRPHQPAQLYNPPATPITEAAFQDLTQNLEMNNNTF